MVEETPFCNADFARDHVNIISYNEVVDALQMAADLFIPKHKKNYRFWWDSQLDVLKENSVRSCEIWKEAGKPRRDPISDKYVTRSFMEIFRTRSAAAVLLMRAKNSFISSQLHTR